MADMLATPADLALLLDRDDLDNDRSTMLLECATAVVQAAAGQRIVQVVDDVLVLDLDGYDHGRYITLPVRPVTAVSAVSVGATAVSDYTVQLRRGRLWRPDGWRSSLATNYGDQPSTVTATVTHGYPPGHQKLQLARAAVLGLTAALVDNPAGAMQIRIDDYAESYDAMSRRLEASPSLRDALRRQYGRIVGSVRLIAEGGRA